MHCTIDMSMSGDIQELIGSDKKKGYYFLKRPCDQLSYTYYNFTLQGIFKFKGSGPWKQC